jgi:16S rRNA (uracil1498-N3)-methyltransferase
MVRLYIDSHLDTGKLIELPEHQLHYLRNVLRLKMNDLVQLFNGRDGEWQGMLETCTKSKAEVRVQQCLRAPIVEANVTLLFAPLKQEAMHFLIEKATELGVSCLQPVTTEFTQIHKLNTEKIGRYCVDAAQQCERLSVPIMNPLQSLSDILQTWPPNKILIVCLERQESLPIASLLQQLNVMQEVAFLVGPEGGLSARDIALLSTHSFVRFCRMGSRILRAETAAIAGIACFQSLRGDWT